MQTISRPLRRAALAALCALSFAVATEPAHAASSASASITGLIVTLTDLDPDDGITPSITWDGKRTGAALQYWTTSTSASGVVYDNGVDWGARTFAPVTAGASTEQVYAEASFLGAGVAKGSGIVTIGLARGGYAGQFSSYEVHAFGPSASWPGIFTLSANTAVSFSALLEVSLSVDWGRDAMGHTEFANAGAWLATGGLGNSPTDQVSILVYSDWDANCNPVTGVCAGASEFESGWFTVSASNLSALPTAGDLYMSTGISGYSEVVAVPEPATNALIALGLAALALTVRRRACGLP
jgi:hypothetical protein